MSLSPDDISKIEAVASGGNNRYEPRLLLQLCSELRQRQQERDELRKQLGDEALDNQLHQRTLVRERDEARAALQDIALMDYSASDAAEYAYEFLEADDE